jgi:ferredoxin-NADP reductase
MWRRLTVIGMCAIKGICGPDVMQDAMEDPLDELRVPGKRVHTERFACNSLGRGRVVTVHVPVSTRPDLGGQRNQIA